MIEFGFAEFRGFVENLVERQLVGSIYFSDYYDEYTSEYSDLRGCVSDTEAEEVMYEIEEYLSHHDLFVTDEMYSKMEDAKTLVDLCDIVANMAGLR